MNATSATIGTTGGLASARSAASVVRRTRLALSGELQQSRAAPTPAVWLPVQARTSRQARAAWGQPLPPASA
jgi:hypothetical protein